jgi:hypothetical protein
MADEIDHPEEGHQQTLDQLLIQMKAEGFSLKEILGEVTSRFEERYDLLNAEYQFARKAFSELVACHRLSNTQQVE